jgi:fructosamine-3-kinase
MPLVQKAVEQNKCSLQDVTLAEKLCDRLDELFPNERPSLIHGDLWSGNFISDQNGRPLFSTLRFIMAIAKWILP